MAAMPGSKTVETAHEAVAPVGDSDETPTDAMSRCLFMNWAGLGATLFLAAAILSPGAEPARSERYERIFTDARRARSAEPSNSVRGWEFSRACYDRADFATNNAQKIEFARQGITAARESILQQPKAAPAHYYLALNLGQLADATRSLGGLKLVSEMEREFKAARDLDAAFDYAGPDRSLGMLYRDAPGWPISVGNRGKARQHLEQARVLSKSYPDNLLTLFEAWLKWGESKKVLAELKSTDAILVEARLQLTGEAWASAWADWDRRWRDIQAKANDEPVRPPASVKGGR